MDVPNIGQVGIGTLIGLAINQGVIVLGKYIDSKTPIKTAEIDDRAKFTKDLMTALEHSHTDHGVTKLALAGCQSENISLMGVVVSIEAELRSIYATMSELLREVNKDPPNMPYIVSLVRSIARSMARLQIIFEEMRDFPTAKLIRHAPIDKIKELDSERQKEE